MTDRGIRVVIADDHPLFRGVVSRTLQEAEDSEVVRECDSANSAIAAATDLLPDVVVLDISMPSNWLECPEVRILILTVSEQDEDVVKAIRYGASGYVLKGVEAEALIKAVRGVYQGQSYISPTVAGRMLSALNRGRDSERPRKDPISDLTHRKEQILRLLA